MKPATADENSARVPVATQRVRYNPPRGHLEAVATRRPAAGRLRAKLALVRRLYELGYDRAGVLRLFRLIDCLLRLPEELEDELWQAVLALEEERQVTYVTSVERIGIRKGLEQGLEQGLAQGRVEGLRAGLAVALELHFGEAGRAVAEELATIQEIAVLEAVAARLRTATTVDEVRAIFQPPTA